VITLDNVTIGDLRRKAILRLLRLQALLAGLLFVPAWTVRFWQAWLYWVVLSGSLWSISLSLLANDTRLMASRLRVAPSAEPSRRQRAIRRVVSVLGCFVVAASAVQRRTQHSMVPPALALAADVLVLAGMSIVFLALRENGHAASVVSVHPGQRVVSTGPYRCVRHPMYAGAGLAILATPPALGSMLGLAFAVPMCAAIAIRLLDEEWHLSNELPGYRQYCARVRYRLVLGIW